MERKAATRARRRKAPGAASAPIAVTEEERRHLIEDCAFFRADRYRKVEPACMRRQDLKDAATDIDAVIDGPRVRRKR